MKTQRKQSKDRKAKGRRIKGRWEREFAKRAERIKEARGISDRELAEKISKRAERKAGRAQVNHWFTGKREPTINQFFLLCEFMGVDPRVILFEVKNPKLEKWAEPLKYQGVEPIEEAPQLKKHTGRERL